MMLNESSILLKNMLVVIYAKILHDSFIPTFFLVIWSTRKFGNLHTGLISVIERINAILRNFYWTIFKQIDIISKNAKDHVYWKLVHVSKQFLHSCHLERNSYSKSLILNSCTHSIFPTLEINMLGLLGKIMWNFDIIFHIKLIHVFFALDISVMIKLLCKMSKFLHEKMLNAIYWY